MSKNCELVVLGEDVDLDKFLDGLKNIPNWEIERAKTCKKDLTVLHSLECPIFVVKLKKIERVENSFTPELLPSLYAVARDIAGEVFEKLKAMNLRVM
jgi:hypothetical protein